MSGRSGPPPMKFGNPGERLRKKRWNLDELPKFEKNFYTEHPEVQRMTQVIFLIFLCPIMLTHSKWITKHTWNWQMVAFIIFVVADNTDKQINKCQEDTSQAIIFLNKVSRGYSQTFVFSIFPPLLLVCPVWGGRIPQEEGDHFERLWLLQGSYRFSPGAVSSWVNHTLPKPNQSAQTIPVKH